VPSGLIICKFHKSLNAIERKRQSGEVAGLRIDKKKL